MVSIIMPAYNAEEYIQESIDSVIAQTFKNWELLIVDDGSTDNTYNIAQRNQLKDSRIKVLRQTNKKQAAARNTGIAEAKGEWIAFIDADDIWYPSKLSTQLNLDINADIIYTNGTIYHQKDKTSKTYFTTEGFLTGAEMYKLLIHFNPIPNLSVVMKRKLYLDFGGQDEALNVWGCEDWEYWIRLAKNGATFYGINECLFTYRVHENGTSANILRMCKAGIYSKYKNLDYRLLRRDIIWRELFTNINYFIWIIKDKSISKKDIIDVVSLKFDLKQFIILKMLIYVYDSGLINFKLFRIFHKILNKLYLG